MKKLSAEIQNILYHLKANKVDNLYTIQALNIINNTIPNSKKSDISNLIDQIPNGIYNKTNELKQLIENNIKIVSNDSLNFSPISINFKELVPCKEMQYRKGNIITGRDNIIDKCLLTLNRKNKRSIILVGQAGTGKTAIVNAINAKLMERTCPKDLIGCYLLNMDIPYILNKYKEDPIGTIVKILELACDYDKAILFIDEVHQLLTNRMNDLLKPYLTEKLRLIGCTTVDEYHNIITDDPAIERRFTFIHVDEPSLNDTIKMLINTKNVYEQHHKCIITEDICKYIVELGNRFIGNRRNPDKALDILDIACTVLNKNNISETHDKQKTEKSFINNLDNNTKELVSLRKESQNRILNKESVDKTISNLINIDYEKISYSLNSSKIKENFEKIILNQKEAVSKFANIINIFKISSYDRIRPISVQLILGPTGCGKKTLSMSLAETLFGDIKSFINYDMSGMKDSFSLTELKGAPPGYVGYKQSGELIKALRNNPSSLVYFRNIHKAHESIISYIVDMCKSGIIVDTAQRSAKLNNSVIIFSVTLNDSEYNQLVTGANKTMGFSSTKPSDAYSKKYLEELVGNNLVSICDSITIFNKLTKDDLKKIFDKNLNYYLKLYNVDIDIKKLEDSILSTSSTGSDVISKLESEIPRMVFDKLT